MSQIETGDVGSEAREAYRAQSVRALAQGRLGERGPLIEILHDVQAEHGWVSEADVRDIAEVLNLSVADVHGVVSFYHDFRTQPPSAHLIRLCGAESCQAMGARELEAHARRLLQDEAGIALEPVYCLGLCAVSPAVMVDGQVHGRVSAQQLEALVASMRRAP